MLVTNKEVIMSFKDAFLDKAKAFAGALAGAVISVVTTTVSDPQGGVTNWEFPNTTGEWVGFAIAVGLGFAAPYIPRNYPSVPAAESTLDRARRRIALGKQTK